MTLYKYRNFKDLEKIDAGLAHKFKQKEDAVRWCMAIEGPVAQWVKSQKRGEGGKALWELVWYASKDLFEDGLNRTQWAEILATFCQDALCTAGNAMSYNPTKAAQALLTSMEHCKYISSIEIFDRLPDANLVRRYVREIKALLDGQELPPPPEPQVITIENRVETYLRNEVVECIGSSVYQRIDMKKDFGNGIVPGLSVSQYHSEKFLAEDKYSHVEAYEFVHEKLTTEKLYAFAGKYGPRREIKLYVVSPICYDREVIRLAEENFIGLVLVNENEAMTQDSYIVQRSIEDHARRLLDMEVLTGQRPMQSTLMIYDGANGSMTTSLADSLVSDGIVVTPEHIIKAPYLTNAYIESQADNLSRSQVDELERRVLPYLADPEQSVLGGYVWRLLSLEVSPAIAANEMGIAYEYKLLDSDEQLGYIDIGRETIFLKQIEGNYSRDRFTFAHELGHYILHLPVFKHYCYTFVGETDKTLNQNASITKGQLSWFEHHANYFAACFLMPRRLVDELYRALHYVYVQKKYGDNYGPLYYNPDQPETHDSYKHVVCKMATILNVSYKAMTLRLKELGLLNMPKNTDSYKSLFRIID